MENGLAEIIGSVKPQRQLSRMPSEYRFPFPAYPNGWFHFVWSHEVQQNKVITRRYFGQELVAYRDEEGCVHVFDAYCPHLGAHLGHGGKVMGSAIQCPFHGWKFDKNGKCLGVPYGGNATACLKEKASLKKWVTREINGAVIIYFHSEGKAPEYEIPVDIEVYGQDKSWSKYQHLHYSAKTHVQEPVENLADMSHFYYRHNFASVPVILKNSYSGHKLTMEIQFKKNVMGKIVTSYAKVTYIGPAYAIVHSYAGPVEFLLVFNSTPIDALYSQQRLTFKVNRSNPLAGLFNWFYIPYTLKKDYIGDLEIWENKKYLENPLLTPKELEVNKFREWYRQFY